MNKALEYIKSKYNGEIPYKYGSNECAKLMTDYAKEYHQSELKNIGVICDVVGQSEQYTCYCKVCGKPFGDKLSLYEHYDEEHN